MNKKIILALSLTLSACSVGPNYQPPQNNFLDNWFSSSIDVSSQETIQTQWWKIFNDPLLTKYIEQSAQNNKDIQISIANIKRARASRQENTASLLPNIGGRVQADRAKSSGANSSFNSGQIRDVYDAGFDASWEIDLFGGHRRELEAANAHIDSAVASYQDVMLGTFAEVARAYYEARGTQKRIAITEQNTDLFKQTYNLIKKRAKIGEASEFDVTRAHSEYQTIQARLPNLQADLQSSIYSLSILLGLPPEALLQEMLIVQALPTPPDLVPVGLRSEILRRRPDVRVAERQLAASSAVIGAEKANLFPKFFITGDLGFQARLFGDLFTKAAGLWSFGSMMQWSVFDGGSTLARIDIAKANNEEALRMYEKVVLEALGDAETALIRYGREIETKNRLEESVQNRREAVRLAQKLLDAGEYDYLDVIDSQRELTSSEDNLVISETAMITKLISLYTALGGGWEDIIRSQ